MNHIRTFLSQHRAATFCVITFAITWSYEFAVVYPLVAGANVLNGLSAAATFAIGAAMFCPALGVLITRLITGEGFKNCLIKPLPLHRSLKWFAFAWFAPAALIALGALIYYCLFPADFDPTCPGVSRLIEAQMAQGANAPTIPITASQLAITQIAVGILLGPALNILTTFGEEWGWRGYLVPKLLERMEVTPAMVLSGAVWGLWHAPITALGHNYGMGYAGFPWTGIMAMMVFCIAAGILLSFVTMKTGSCLAAAIGHGSINSLAAAPIMFSISGGNPFIGPAPTGIVGGLGLLIVAGILLFKWNRV